MSCWSPPRPWPVSGAACWCSLLRGFWRWSCGPWPARFRLRLAQSLASGSSFLPTELGPDDSAGDIATKVFDLSARTLLEVRQQLQPARLEQAIALLAGARRLEFYGLGSSGIVAADARHKFFRLGIVATAYADAHLHGMAARHAADG